MRARENDLRMIYLIIDLLILNTAIFITVVLENLIEDKTHPDIWMYLIHGNLSWIITYYVFAKRNLYLRDEYIHRVMRISKRVLIFLLVSSVLAFLATSYSYYQRMFLFHYVVIFYLGELLFYRLLYMFLKHKRKRGFNINRAVIIGVNDTTELLKLIMESNPMLGYKFLGFVANDELVNHQYLLGTDRDLDGIINEYKVNEVFASLPYSEKGKDYLKVCNKMGVRLFYVPETQNSLRNFNKANVLGDFHLINPQHVPLDDYGNRILKRLFDIVFSLLIIILILSWLFPIIALIIKCESKGPVFFTQKRTGISNRPFPCIKFRSMVVNKDANKQQAQVNDKRITKFGNLMRKYNIDELPQFINVLLGHMSVVGPRPHMLQHTAEYSALIEHYLVRHYVKPGITGWAQISGYRGITDELWKMNKRVDYDMEYIENWNFWWDIQIIWKTVFGKTTYTNAG